MGCVHTLLTLYVYATADMCIVCIILFQLCCSLFGKAKYYLLLYSSFMYINS